MAYSGAVERGRRRGASRRCPTSPEAAAVGAPHRAVDALVGVAERTGERDGDHEDDQADHERRAASGRRWSTASLGDRRARRCGATSPSGGVAGRTAECQSECSAAGTDPPADDSPQPDRAILGQAGTVVQRPPAGTIPDAPGSYQFKDADGRVIYVGKAKSLRSRLSNYFQNPATCRRAPRRWWRRPRPSSGSRSATTSRRSCSSTASSSSTGPASTSGCVDDKSYPFLAVTVDDEWPRAMVMRGAQAQGRPLLRALRPRLRHPRDARPAAAHVPDPHLLATTSSTATSGSAGRACCSTSRSARARASARSTSERVRRAASTSCSSSSTATPTPVVKRLERRDARGRRRARVRAGGPAARPAGQRCARPSRSSRWWPTATRTST